jgi:ribonucleoside-diphosphate reductase beta chain
MTRDIFGPDWIDAWAEEIRASEAYRKAARRWRWPLLLVLRADREHGVAEDRRVYLDLGEGQCREARPGSADDVARAEFVLSADLSTWAAVLDGALDPLAGIVRRKLSLEKGSMATLAMHSAAAKALVATAARVETSFAGSPARDGTAAPEPAPPAVVAAASSAGEPGPSASREPSASEPRTDGAFVSTGADGLRMDSPPMRLWRKAKRLGIWNPEDIDFGRDREDWRGLDALERDVLLRLTGMFLAGEESVTVDLLPLIMVIAREGRLEEEMFLTTFLWEEAKHVDFFHTGFVRSIAPDAGDLSRYHTPAYRRIFCDELPRSMSALLTDPSPAAQARASVTYNMIVEGVLAETGYEAYFAALERNDLLPGLREGLGHLRRDEARHIAYGVFLLSRLIAADASLWEVVEARMSELFPLAIEMIEEIFAAYDVMPFGLRLDDFAEIAATNFGRRMQRIERARGQTLEEVYEIAEEAVSAGETP